jgi:hypothetical protein
MVTMDRITEGAARTPLAVCVNDCRLDCGQSALELAPVCFQVGCAFAEMRWGRRTPAVARLPDERDESR